MSSLTMVTELYVLLVVAFATFILAATIWVLARGAHAWADATAATHRARAHGVQADMERETIEHARGAAERVMAGGGRPPTPEEIREAILRQRDGQTDDGREYTTSGDVTPDELASHMQGGEYRDVT